MTKTSGPGSSLQRGRAALVVLASALFWAAIALVVVLLTGCIAPLVQRHPTPSGRDVVITTCNVQFRPATACLTALELECPAGYEVIDRDQVGSRGTITVTARCNP